MDQGRELKSEYLKPMIELPYGTLGDGKLISRFAKELGELMSPGKTLFFRTSSMEIIELNHIFDDLKKEKRFIGFSAITPSRFITLIEDTVTTYYAKRSTNGEDLKTLKSMSRELAVTVLHSEQFQKLMPQLDRIFTIPIPILHNNELTFPKQGYDPRFKSWLPYNAPKISTTDADLDLSKKAINGIFEEFCLETEQDKTNAIAALLTPFLRGLYSRFTVRTPVFFYMANRERAGKDYCAGINGILYEGHATEEPPVSTEDKFNSHSEELRKKIFATLRQGKKRMHFANNKGYLNNATLEQVTTNERYNDRLLGSNNTYDFDNELEFSMSGNLGITFTPDFANRSVFIKLFLDIEDANSRPFKTPDLHGFIKENRGEILSALFCFVKEWFNAGQPKGETVFTSFPEWANICGGIMIHNGFGDPCKKSKDVMLIKGDTETEDMKTLYELIFEKYPETYIERLNIITEIISYKEAGESFFLNYDLENKSKISSFWNMFYRFMGRQFSDIKIKLNEDNRPSRDKYMFTKKWREK